MLILGLWKHQTIDHHIPQGEITQAYATELLTIKGKLTK